MSNIREDYNFASSEAEQILYKITKKPLKQYARKKRKLAARKNREQNELAISVFCPSKHESRKKSENIVSCPTMRFCHESAEKNLLISTVSLLAQRRLSICLSARLLIYFCCGLFMRCILFCFPLFVCLSFFPQKCKSGYLSFSL